MMDPIIYSIQFSPFKSQLILKQLVLAIGLPFGTVFGLLIVIKAWYGVLVVLILLSTSLLFVLLAYGRYHVRVLISDKTIRVEPDRNQKKFNRFLNTLTMLAGILSRNLSVTGTGYLAHANQIQVVSWKNIKTITKRKSLYEIKCNYHQTVIMPYPDSMKREIDDYMFQMRSVYKVVYIDKSKELNP